MTRENENAEARQLLADHVFAAIKAAMAESPHPQLVMAGVPMTMAGIAGSYVLQFLRARILADGQVDAVLDELVASMRDHANPSHGANQDEAVALTDEARAFLRGLFTRG